MKTSEETTKKGLYSASQLRDIQKQQQKGSMKMIVANKASESNIKDEYFRQLYTDFKIPAIESNYYHVAVESRLFDPLSGKRLTAPKVSVFNPEMFASLESLGNFKGKTVVILHDPTLK